MARRKAYRGFVPRRRRVEVLRGGRQKTSEASLLASRGGTEKADKISQKNRGENTAVEKKPPP